jgi:hypothetical protein
MFIFSIGKRMERYRADHASAISCIGITAVTGTAFGCHKEP